MKKERTSLRLSELEPNTGQIEWLPKNPRQWTQDDIDRTAKSIAEDYDFLEDRPLLAVPHDGRFVVFAGNLRMTAARQGKVDSVPVIVYTVEDDADQQTILRRAMKDNGSFGAWDWDALANEWDDLPLGDWGVPVWDADKEEEGAGVAGGAAAQEDDFDEESDEIHVRCKKGDIWQLGEHRLMCGDSTDLEMVKALMGGALADLLLTDPPYNVDYGDETQMVMEKRRHRTDGLIVMNDNLKSEDFLKLLFGAFARAVENMKPGSGFYIFHADTEGLNFRKAVYSTKDMHLSECLIWRKDALCLGRSDYQWIHEPCLYGWKEGAAHRWYSDRKQTTVFEFARPKRSEEHPTMKPIALFAYLMGNSTKKDDLVLDLFGGSGTTLIAAEQLGRKCYMMELDPHYCDVIIARWEKLTGKTATKIN